MKQLLVMTALGAALLMGCQETPVQSPNPTSGQATGQRTLAEISVGEGSVTFLKSGEYIAILEKRRPNAAPILTEDMAGLTFGEIHQRLAPGVKVPDELAKSQVKYNFINPDARKPEAGSPVGGQNELLPAKTQSLAKTADLNDSWFRNNYCIYPNGLFETYSACLLNRSGPGTDWAWANANFSVVRVYPHTGTFIHLNGKVNGNNVFDTDLLVGWVYTWNMTSDRPWWGFGCTVTRQHYYTITHTSGQFWHWSLGSSQAC
jgi:hypothetical protein